MSPEDPEPTRSAPAETATRRAVPTKLRFSQTALIAIVMIALMGTPFALSLLPWSLLVYLILAIAAFAIRRTGAWISADVITVTGPTYRRTIALKDVAALSVSARGGVFLVRSDGSSLLIPTARARDLPRLRELVFGSPDRRAVSEPLSDAAPITGSDTEPDL